MKEKTFIRFDDVEYENDHVVVTDALFLDELRNDPSQVLAELSTCFAPLSLEQIFIGEAGKITINNEAFAEAVRSSADSGTTPQPPYEFPLYVTNNWCGDSEFGYNPGAYSRVANYWCDGIMEVNGTNYQCT